MRQAAVAARPEQDLSRPRLRERDQLRERLCRYGRIDHQHEGEGRDQRQRREIALDVEAGTAGIDHWIDREVPGRAEEDRMTVRLRLRDALSRDQPGGTRTIFHDRRLAEPL